MVSIAEVFGVALLMEGQGAKCCTKMEIVQFLSHLYYTNDDFFFFYIQDLNVLL